MGSKTTINVKGKTFSNSAISKIQIINSIRNQLLGTKKTFLLEYSKAEISSFLLHLMTKRNP